MLEDVDLTNGDFALLARAKKLRYGYGVPAPFSQLELGKEVLLALSDLSFAMHDIKGEFYDDFSSLHDKITAQLEKAEEYPTLTMEDILGAEKAQVLQAQIDEYNETIECCPQAIKQLESELKTALNASSHWQEQFKEVTKLLEESNHELFYARMNLNAIREAIVQDKFSVGAVGDELRAKILRHLMREEESTEVCVKALLELALWGCVEAKTALEEYIHALESNQKENQNA